MHVDINTPKTLGVTPRYILQHNVISRSSHNLSATAKKLTAMAMALLPPDLSSLTASFTFTEFCKAVGYEKSGKSFDLFLAGLKECVECSISLEITSADTGEKIWENYTWFLASKFTEKTGVASMTFSPHLASVLAELKRVYSKILLLDIGKLQSKYAIRLFELAISYSSLMGKKGNKDQTWYFERDIKDLRFLMGIPKNAYKETRLFRQKVIDGPVKELNKAGIGFTIKTVGVKQGRNLTAIRFDCHETLRTFPKKNKSRKENSPAPTEQTEAQRDALNDDRIDMEYQYLKNRYPEEFARLYAEELAKPSFLPPTNKIRQIATESIVLARLREKYGIVI